MCSLDYVLQETRKFRIPKIDPAVHTNSSLLPHNFHVLMVFQPYFCSLRDTPRTHTYLFSDFSIRE